MIPSHYFRFEVEIVNKQYVYSATIEYPYTAVITFFNERNKRLHTEDYGYMPTEAIYDKLETNNYLEIPKCYIKNFSLTAYRRLRLMHKHDYVMLEGIDAQYAFFDAHYYNDFSYLKIEQGDVNFENAHFAHGNLNFTNGSYGIGGVNFSYLLVRSHETDFSNTVFGTGDVSFKNSIFYNGKKTFQYTDFGEGDISFVNVDFGGGDISFINTNFNSGNVSFKVADFGEGITSFYYSKFNHGDISFERTNFNNGETDFRKVEFGNGKLNFNRAIFGNGNINFEAAGADGKVTFKRTEFGNGTKNFEILEFENVNLNMQHAVWGEGSISFHESNIKTLSLDGSQFNSYLDLRLASCNNLDLSDTIIRDIVDLKPYNFDIKLNGLNLAGMRLLGIIYCDWFNNKIEQMVCSQTSTTLSEKAEQFRLLKENFNNAGQYDHEDKAYVLFKRFELKAELERVKNGNLSKKIKGLPNYIFQKLVFDYAGLYATDPMRVLVSMIVAYVAFSLFYIVALATNTGGIVSGIGNEHDLIGVVGRSFYHSGITFLTIGYGDFYPLGAVRWLSNIEGFVGVFLMSYFTVAFVRKILR